MGMQLNQFIYENRLLWQTVADPSRSRECRLQWLEHGGYFYLKIGNGNFGSCVLENRATINGLFVHQIIPFLSAQEAFGSCSAISAQNGWALYYVRPKIHMFCHLLPLGSRVSVGPLQYAIYFQFSSMCEIAEATNGVCA